MKIVLERPPQGGKTTFALVAKERYGLCYVSTSEAVRNAVYLSNNACSSQLKHLIDNDELIPEPLVVKAVAKATRRPDCINSFILDDFPRTRKQLKLPQDSENVEVDKVVVLEIADRSHRHVSVVGGTTPSWGASITPSTTRRWRRARMTTPASRWSNA
ncbi:hypothetical protein CUR178_01340 [Leishmania enriettii]|uniref:Adenylate kinase n=1 Tax=Leishmania enriettii TaxID=5663 RepID=A0A836H1Z2_LEIEN|nr:hypothetical protein CUR178_01340 [Leishmania enriettii]